MEFDYSQELNQGLIDDYDQDMVICYFKIAENVYVNVEPLTLNKLLVIDQNSLLNGVLLTLSCAVELYVNEIYYPVI